MTDEERKNRNPAPELGEFKLAECPEVQVKDLQIHHVYILHSQRNAVSVNYMGIVHTIDPRTLDAMVVYHFYGPRAKFNCYLSARSDGSLEDAAGNQIRIRQYTGPDA